MTKPKTIAVIGGGSAGFTAAKTARGLGARVLFFMGENADRASLCINAGCMPSKALFQPIDEMHHARRRGWWRVEPVQPERYLAQIVAWKDRQIAGFRAWRQREIADCAGDDFVVVRANARFVDAHTVEAQGQRFGFDAAIIATGSAPSFPRIDGLDQLRGEVWTSEEILDNTTLPESLAVVGAGAVGLELALRYARLGCAVTMMSRRRLLHRYGAIFGERLQRAYERENIRVLTDVTVTGLQRDRDGWLVLAADAPGGTELVVAQRVLVATGRRPALDGLGLDAAGLQTDERGRICVGADMRVRGQTHIFAAGDVCGERMVVHTAHIEAGIAAENAVCDARRQLPKKADLRVIFSDPEFAYAGITAGQATGAGHAVVTASEDSRNVGKLHLAGDELGVGEFVADCQTHRLLGAGLLCADAGELIHLPGYAIDHEHTVQQLAAAEYYHPTKIELVSSIADALCEQLGASHLCRADE
jgi:pyruvate/2-oxoglutarate dehydrogenase complex dihydrolipoamide dehydrogenase (E3) component